MELVLKKFEDKQILKDLGVTFGPKVEITNIIQTLNKDWLQIVTKDHAQDVVSIITWDFEIQMEQRHLQQIVDENRDVGYHVVKGMN
jgi:hypothetical protein